MLWKIDVTAFLVWFIEIIRRAKISKERTEYQYNLANGKISIYDTEAVYFDGYDQVVVICLKPSEIANRRKISFLSSFILKTRNIILARLVYFWPSRNSWRIAKYRWRGVNIGETCIYRTTCKILIRVPEFIYWGEPSGLWETPWQSR